jgi:hypothetical protein
MSRYQWPREVRSPDRARERAHYTFATTGVLPAGAVTAMRAALGSMPSRAARDAPSGDANLWVPIGPSTVLKGQAGMNPRVAGRVRDLWIADNGLRAYAASANGGVWVTFDAGNTWAPLGNWLHPTGADAISRPASTLTCGCLLVNFNNAVSDGSSDEIYVGTGEIVPTVGGIPGRKLGGVGILRLDKLVPAVLADPFDRHHWKREAKNLASFGIFRLAHHPTDATQMIAGTSIGLFKRESAIFIENADWTRVTAGPFNFTETSGKKVTDMLWVPSAPKPRLFVALSAGSDTDVWFSTDGVDGPYTRVNLPNVVHDSRLALAVAPSDPDVVFVLGGGPRLWRITGTTPTQVQKIPDLLFGKRDQDQSSYDMAVAIHPNDPAIVSVGGSAVNADGEWSASLFQFTIAPSGGGLTAGFLDAFQADPGSDATFIGTGVHADVHQIRYVKVGGDVHLWVTCDGGVFRSVRAGQQYTFVARNAGLAVLESGYVASHPVSDAYVIAGAQDNGLLMRMGDTVWVHNDAVGGDGGGCLFHPIKNRFFAAQYTRANWNSNGTHVRPVLRGTGGDSEKNENRNASFYSGADARQVGAAQVRLAIGTNRVWLADNWDPEAATSWVTLHSNTDPRAGTATDESTDVVGGGTGSVVACKWVDDNRVVAMFRSSNSEGKDTAIVMMRRKNDGTWERVVLSSHSNKSSSFGNGDIDQPTSPYFPPLGSWSDIAVHDPARGPNGSLYAAATGDGTSDRMDTLWWYNGDDKWHPTTLRSSILGTTAPTYAVAVDPTDANTVYAGTALGVWRGVLSFAGADPHWDWNPFSNGLPEAAVHDISFYNHGAVKLLRAAIQARGVWEVDLSAAPSPTRRTFLRVHPNDARRVAPTPLVNPMKDGPANYLWHASPDIRIRQAPLGAAEPIPVAPADLPWNAAAADAYQLWIFQTAFHAIDLLCRTTGLWDNQFSERLRRQDPASGTTIDAARWGAIITRANAFATPWEGAEPTEADLYELIVEDPPNVLGGAGPVPPPISRVASRNHLVDVLVHYRDLRPLKNDQVRVALLRRPLPDDRALWPGIALSDAWKTAVAGLMSGAPPGAFPDTWAVADPATPTRQLTSDIDARTPRAVTFNVDFTGLASDEFAILLAVVHSTPDPVNVGTLTGATIQDLVLNCHQAAARIVRAR